MKAALRLAVCVVMASAMAPTFAQSNRCGDGEANVPLEKCTEKLEVKKGGGAPVRSETTAPTSNRCGDGEANIPFESCVAMTETRAGAEELGGGAGEPGRAEMRAKDEAALREHARREFLKHVWEDP